MSPTSASTALPAHCSPQGWEKGSTELQPEESPAHPQLQGWCLQQLTEPFKRLKLPAGAKELGNEHLKWQANNWIIVTGRRIL